ncbi:NAD(P)H-dependent flavin oxidoreductase [Microbacterium sp. GXF7504]
MHTDLTDLLGIRHPILLGPFGGLSSVELVAAVSASGGLGSYGLYGYDGDRVTETAAAIRAATDRPFALNLWLPLGRAEHGAPFDAAVAAVRDLFAEVGVEPPTAPPETFLPPVDVQWEAAVTARPAAISCVYGIPSTAQLDAAHAAGITVIGTATTVAEAVALEAAGVDAVVATGFEAAGHRVSFLRDAEASLVGTFALVPQVADAVGIPVVAAGGIADHRGVRAAFALGASGVQVGTAFLRTRQSAASDAHRRTIASTAAEDAVLTRAMSGRLARGARNRAMRTIEEAGAIAAFPVQNWLTGGFRAAAGRAGLGDLQSLWLGQPAPLATREDADEVFAELLAGVPD